MKIHAPLCCLLLVCFAAFACDDDGSKKKTGEALCADGLDNDGDGFADCDDQDCWPSAACQTNNVNNVNNANNVNNVNNQVCDGAQDVKDFHWLDKSRTLKIYHGTLSGPALCMAPSQRLAVGALLQYDGGWGNVCTGTLVTDRHFLTAAHCASDWRGDPLSAGELRVAFGDDADSPLATYEVLSVSVNPGYGGYSAKTGEDHAVLTLDGNPMADHGISPIPISRTSPRPLIGHYVQQAGFGTTESSYNNTRLWWTPELVSGVSDADGELIVDGQGYSSVCNGDSGGPSLYPLEGNVLSVLGTVSWGDPSCVDVDRYARTDWNLDYLDTAIPAFDACAGLTEAGTCEGNVARWCEGGLPRTECCDARTGPCAVVGGLARCGERRTPCTDQDFEGACSGDTARWCWGGLVHSRNCAACNSTCVPDAGSVFGAYCE
jgi:hypothetical protein